MPIRDQKSGNIQIHLSSLNNSIKTKSGKIQTISTKAPSTKSSVDIITQHPSLDGSTEVESEANVLESVSANNQVTAFADTIDQQREMARRRLEQDRQVEEAL